MIRADAPTLIDYELASVALKKLRHVLALAATTGLTTYDASYLWVAKSLGVELVSLDRELNWAAERL